MKVNLCLGFGGQKELELRDAALALQYAQKACELTNFESWAFVDTLAAAYAENGDFEKAVELMQQVALIAPPTAQSNISIRIQNYKSEKAVHE